MSSSRLLNWIRRIESTLDAQLPLGTSLKIQTAGLERADIATRYAAYSVGLDKGFLTVADVRDLEDLGPMELDDPFGNPDDVAQETPPSSAPPQPQEVPTP